MKAAKGVLRTEAGMDEQSTPAIGFGPQAFVAWWSCQPALGSAAGNRGGIGFWTAEGSTSVAWSSTDGVRSISTHHVAEDAALVGLDASGGEVSMRAELGSFDPTGVALRSTRPPTETWFIHYLALGGLTGARTGWLASTAEAPAVRLAGGMRPDLVLLAPAPYDSAAGLTIGVGAIAGRTRGAAGYACRDGDRPGTVVGAQRLGDPTVAPDANGFSYLALAGVRAKVGADVSPGAPGARRTRVGFTPEALLLFSWGLARSRRPRGIGRLCLGAVVDETCGVTSWDDCNVDTGVTRTHVASSVEHALVVADTRTGGVHAEATAASLDDRGFTLDWGRSDRGRRQFVYVALGSPR